MLLIQKPAQTPLWNNQEFSSFWIPLNNAENSQANSREAKHTHSIKDFDINRNNLSGAEGLCYGYTINGEEYNAIINGKNFYTEEEKRNMAENFMETLLWITPIKFPFAKLALKSRSMLEKMLGEWGLYKMQNVGGWEWTFSKNFRIGWHSLPKVDYFGAGKSLPHYHRRPGIGKHRSWQGL